MVDVPTTPSRPHSAEYFGELRDHWWNGDFLRLMAERLGFLRVGSVLDVGCGVGHWGRVLEPVLPREAHLIGVDREPQWVQEAAARAEKAGLATRFSYREGDAMRLPFPDDTFDLVTCQTVLIHLPDAREALREMLRVTRRGGLVLAVEPSNFANSAAMNTFMDALPTDEVMRALRFVLICQRGKRALGQGFNSIGDQVPGMLAALGAADILVYLSDKSMTLLPPYTSADALAAVAQLKDWTNRDFWVWDKPETRRYFLAGGGTEVDFESNWGLVMGHQRAILDAIDAGTFHDGGGVITYLVAGRKA